MVSTCVSLLSTLVLVLAGVGSGCTEVVNEHILAEVEETMGPEASRDRFFEAPAPPSAPDEVGTFHFTARLHVYTGQFRHDLL